MSSTVSDSGAAASAAPEATAPGAPDPMRPPLDDLRVALSQLFGAERRLRGREHVPGELTHAHIRSLHALSEEGEQTVGQLARSADLNPASVTAMLDQIEEMGVVVRARSTSDRRVCNVSLTPAGRELLAEKSARWRALWADRLAGFDDDELDAARRVIGAMTGIFDSVANEKERRRADAGR